MNADLNVSEVDRGYAFRAYDLFLPPSVSSDVTGRTCCGVVDATTTSSPSGPLELSGVVIGRLLGCFNPVGDEPPVELDAPAVFFLVRGSAEVVGKRACRYLMIGPTSANQRVFCLHRV